MRRGVVTRSFLHAAGAAALVLAVGGTSVASVARGPSSQQPGQAPRTGRAVPYLPGGSSDQVLDFFWPDARGFPIVVFVHGGSLQETGERRTSEPYARVCEAFMLRGIGCASVDYRLAPGAKWPAMPDDVAAAVRWVRTNALPAGADPGRLFLFGHSSGCQLVAALGANSKFLGGVGLSPADVAGVIAMGCTLAPLEEATSQRSPEQLEARWAAGSSEVTTYATFQDRLDSDPSRFLGPHVPPLLVVASHEERFFPPVLEQGAKVVRRLLQLGRPANVVLVPGTHMSSISDFHLPNDPTFREVANFIADPSLPDVWRPKPARQDSNPARQGGR